jgi:ammonium transporter, Amt family
VSPQLPAAAPELSQAFCIFFIFLLPLALAGLALINTGLSRSRSAAHSMMATLCVMGVAAAAYFVTGFAWQGYPGLPAHTLTIFGKDWSWLGAGNFFLRGVPLNGSPASLAALLQMLSVGLAALVPLGAAAERWRLRACCLSTAILAGITYPLFAHWVWGGGWLWRLGQNYGLGAGFLDAGGSSTIQVVGGLTALSMVWLLGPRRGKYNLEGMPAALPGHNTVYVLFGCLLALVGWMGLNAAGSILFAHIEPGRTVLVAVNTLLSASGAVLAAAAITRYRFGKPDASLSANGWVCGLVASSAGCAYVPPAAALLIGLVAGALVTFTVAWMEAHLGLDDPAGAISVHALGGVWGILAVGLFPRTVKVAYLIVTEVAPGVIPSREMLAQAIANAPHPAMVPGGQMLAQIVGVATLVGFVLPLTYSLNWLLNRFVPQRIPPEEERHGADLYELGAGAYPEFMTHTDEFSQW